MLESAPGSGQTMALVRGPGGVGKSTLASQAVLRYGGQYRGGLTFRCAGYAGIEVLLQQLAEFGGHVVVQREVLGL